MDDKMEDIDIQRLREENERLVAENNELFYLKEQFEGIRQDRDEAIEILRRLVDAMDKPNLSTVLKDIKIAYGKR